MTRKDVPWIVFLPGRGTAVLRLMCVRCAGRMDVAEPITVTMVGVIAKQFHREHRGCEAHADGDACTVCSQRGHTGLDCVTRHTAAVKSEREWLTGPDTGLSSLTIWAQMTGTPQRPLCPATPQDAGDLGRCVRLLNRFSEWRARMGEMRALPGWAPLVAAWAQLEDVYRLELPNRRFPATDRMLDRLNREGEKIKGDGGHACHT